MATFRVNHQTVHASQNTKLLPFLRDTLGLTSVKNGCSEGACGTCMVIVDGVAKKACVLQTDRLENKHILTIEGLSSYEKEVYGYAFLSCGAVQCGFCIPGMIMSAKALLDTTPYPTPAQVKKAIKNNICRCTGYKKIEQAILLAAMLLAEQKPIPKLDACGNVGTPLARVEGLNKILGTALYTDDLTLPHMLYGGAVRTLHPRARIVSIDTTKAQALEGVVAVVTSEAIPGNKKIGHLRQDWDVLIPVGEVTRYIGDAIVLIAATSQAILEEAKKLVAITYEVLTPLTNPLDALQPDAPAIHPTGNLLQTEHLVRGDADAKIQEAAYVVTNHYSTPFTEHAFLEPETALATYVDDQVIIYCGDQGVYQTRKECASMLGLPEASVRVVGQTVGGGFGGKEDMSVQHHAALLAYMTKQPVKVSLSRKESLVVHPKRHAMEMTFTTACDANGYLLATKAVILSDTGAYASLGGPVLQRACTHAAGPYNYQDIDILGKAVYTNNPPAGAFRGFGVTQSCFALESNLNQLAECVGISGYEIRLRNAIRPGQVLPNGQIADDSTALVETLEAVKPIFESSPYAGIACAMKNAGLGVGIKDVGRCHLAIIDGKVHIYTSAACIGQGLGTVMTQIVCEATGLSPSLICHEAPDTSLTPNSGNTTASRQTLFTGEATHMAAKKLATDLQTQSLAALEGTTYDGEYEGITDGMHTDKPHPVSHIAYGYATHVVTLNTDGTLNQVVAAHDVGRAINPLNIEGQIEGGVTMSLGYALTEDYPLHDGVPTAKFGTLGLFKSVDVPCITTYLIEKNACALAFGAKGIGEIASIPTAPAVAHAYLKFDGVRRQSLPLSSTPYSK